ncbi:MAG: hypothetical protein OEZ13_09670 [Spirochaetia bacterium]|nr:hypothetical protein [Spirochaetia bacterium]
MNTKLNIQILLTLKYLSFLFISFFISCASFFVAEESPEEKLEKISMATNEALPMMIDSFMRLDATKSDKGRIFYYYYTVIETAPKRVFSQNFLDIAMKPVAIKNYKTNDSLQFQRDNNVTLIYIYKDSKGVEFGRIQINPNDF